MAIPNGWTMTENGWTWIGPGPQPGVDPFHVPAATTPGTPSSVYYDDRAGDLGNLSKITTNTADDSGFYVPDWLKSQGGSLAPTSQAAGQAVSSYAHTPGGGFNSTPDYFYNTTNLADKSGGYSPYANPDQWTRIANDPMWQQAMATGNYAALNGHKTYDVLDRNGNVVDTKTFDNLDNGDSYDQIVMALVGAGFGAIAAGAAAAGGAAAGSGPGAGGAATTVGGTGATGATGTLGATGATGYGLSPSILTTPTLAEGAGLTGTSSLAGGAGLAETGGGLFANPAMWSGAVPSGVGYGFTPSLGALPAGSGGGIPAGGGGGGAASPTGTPPPANPYATGTGGTESASSLSNIMNGTGTAADYAKLGIGALTTLGGAAAGSQGQQNSATQQSQMDPRMAPYIYDSLLPGANGLLQAQVPQAMQNSQALQQAGMGLLGTPTTPDFANNPYMASMANDLQRRTQQLLDTNNQSIAGNAVATGSLGGSRQGVAQGLAAGQAADSLQGQLANLYGNQFNIDSSRALQAQTLGAGMLAQGQQTAWAPFASASDIFKPYTGLNSSQTTTSQTGGGTSGLIGGAVSGAAFGHQMGWW